MQKVVLIFAIFLVNAIAFTSLNHYVNYNDEYYHWEQSTTITNKDYTCYNLFLTSQKWLTHGEVNVYIWHHWVQVVVPTKLIPNGDLAYVYINGGSNPDLNNPPTDVDTVVTQVATSTGLIGVNLRDIPNQPVVFSADINGRARSEDALIAFTWSHFINNTLEYDWLARMPMTKASIIVMDVVQEFVAQHLPTLTPVTRFAFAGGSKRGWTTWMVGGMDDPRVVAIVPIVAPVANLVPQINEMWQSYGNWSFALKDYVDMDLMGWLNLPRFTEMLDIIDPLSYPESLAKIPKFVVNACGDEFFMPDAAQYYWNSLSGGKYLYMVPNAEHSLAGHILDVLGSAEQFLLAVFYNQLDILPEYSWEISEQGNTVTLTTLQTNYIVGARVYYSQNNTARDWRLITCTETSPSCINPALFGSEELTPVSPGVYTYTLPLPPSGMYSAMMIEVSYNFGYPALAGASRKPFHITSDLSIFPRGVYPYPPCPADVCSCGYDCARNYYGNY